jgi:hypothetical protein
MQPSPQPSPIPCTLPVPMSYFPPILSDPQLAISKRDQNRILGAASSAWFKKRSNTILYSAAIITLAISMAGATVLIGRLATNSTIYTVLLWTIAFPLYLFACHYLIFHLGFRPFLYQILRQEGHDICLKCGYILIDIPNATSKCPECGTERTPLPPKPIAE